VLVLGIQGDLLNQGEILKVGLCITVTEVETSMEFVIQFFCVVYLCYLLTLDFDVF